MAMRTLKWWIPPIYWAVTFDGTMCTKSFCRFMLTGV